MLDQFADYLREQDRADKTIKNYLAVIQRFAVWYEEQHGEALTLNGFTTVDVRNYRQHLVKTDASPATINSYLAALRALGAWAVAAHYLDRNPAENIRDLSIQPHAPKWLDGKEQNALKRVLLRNMQNSQNKSTENRFLAARNNAVVIFLLNTGLRISEMTAMTLTDVSIKDRSGEVKVRAGKGNKFRTVPLNKDARAALQDWLKLRPAAISECIFTTYAGDPLSQRSVQNFLQELSVSLKFTVTPHVLRHTFAKNLIDSGVPIEQVADLLGHSKLETTRVYVTPSADDLKRAVEQIVD